MYLQEQEYPQQRILGLPAISDIHQQHRYIGVSNRFTIINQDMRSFIYIQATTADSDVYYHEK